MEKAGIGEMQGVQKREVLEEVLLDVQGRLLVNDEESF